MVTRKVECQMNLSKSVPMDFLKDNYTSLKFNKSYNKVSYDTSNVIKWDFSNAPIISNNVVIEELPNNDKLIILPKKKQKLSELIASSIFVGASLLFMNSTVASAESNGGVASSGIFLPLFLQHIFPLMLDIASVYCVIRIGMDFYNAQRGGGRDSAGLGSVITHGKWLVFFYLIPFAIALLEELGMKLMNGVGR